MAKVTACDFCGCFIPEQDIDPINTTVNIDLPLITKDSSEAVRHVTFVCSITMHGKHDICSNCVSKIFKTAPSRL